MISARELAEREHQRRGVRKQTYQTILEQFSRKVRAAAERRETTAILVVPPMVLGFPMYPFDEAVAYIERQLKRAGYIVAPGTDHGNFRISWARAVPRAAPPAETPRPEDDLFSGLANLQKTAARLRENRR
jgi:hypothetical protein